MAGGISFEGDESHVMSDINVTPLVDVVLVLLIVFMITVPAIVGTTPVQVDLPQTAYIQNLAAAEQLPLNIFLKRENNRINYYWNDNLVSETEFRNRLTQMRATKDQEVSISADKDIAYDNVMRVMDMLASVGIHKISLPTKHVVP